MRCPLTVTAHPVVGSRSLPGRTSAPAARSASGWAAYVRRGAGMSTHPYLHATSRAPCCGGRRSPSPGPTMPCSRASNSRRPDLVVSLDYPMTGLCWLTQHVPSPMPRATGRMACLLRDRQSKTAREGPFASMVAWARFGNYVPPCPARSGARRPSARGLSAGARPTSTVHPTGLAPARRNRRTAAPTPA